MRGVKKSKEKFFGREAELAQLDGLWFKDTASLVTCRGRRRIGKSTLIEEFARRSGARFLKLEGLRPKPGMTERALPSLSYGHFIKLAYVYRGIATIIR